MPKEVDTSPDEIELVLAEAQAKIKESMGLIASVEAARAKSAGTPLEKAWKELQENCASLSCEMYIDDQIELEYVEEITSRILADEGMRSEAWKLRFDILKDIVMHDYYQLFDCEEHLRKFPEWLCVEPKEWMEYADFLFGQREKYHKQEALYIYRKYGTKEEYLKAAERNLGAIAQPYMDLINYYKESNPAKAEKLARLALANCKDDITDIVVFLAVRAKEKGDIDEVEKLKDFAYDKRNARYMPVWEAVG